MTKWLPTPVKDLYRAYQKWRQDDGSHLAASVSYYMAISFFPLLLVLIAGFGCVLRFSGWGQNARQRFLDVIAEQTSPALAQQMEALLANVQENALIGGPIGLLTLLLASLAVFVHFDDAMDRIWNVSRVRQTGLLASLLAVLSHRLRAFLMLLGIGVFVVLGFAASMSLAAAGQLASDRLPTPGWTWNLLTLSAAIALNWLLFMIVYRTVPNVPVRWREAARGALFASIMWELGRRVLAVLVIGSRLSVYGIVGALVAVMLWTFYANAILFLGAEYIQVVRQRSGD